MAGVFLFYIGGVREMDKFVGCKKIYGALTIIQLIETHGEYVYPYIDERRVLDAMDILNANRR